MILRTVHEAHGFEGSERIINGSGPRVLWTLGGGSKANYIHPLSGVLRTGYAASAPRRPALKPPSIWPVNGSGMGCVVVLVVFYR